MAKRFISFDIKTGMKNIIGRDLITDDFIAIYELVKNSYDAYAQKVVICFDHNKIVISDNGKGMSDTDLTGKWFAVAYSAKKDGTEDDENQRSSHLKNLKSRRFYAGAKGVGRFSCDRLGNNLRLVTKNIQGRNTYQIDVDWTKFEEDAKQSFGDIKIELATTDEKAQFPDNKAHGTILQITNLNSPWTYDRLTELKKSLEKLINPFSAKNDFTIEIVAPNFRKQDDKKPSHQRVNGVINNSILKVLDIKTTQIDVKVNGDKIITKLNDRGKLIYHIEEPNSYFKYVDNLEIDLYYLNRSAKINFGKIMDIEPINYGNVFLFKNGFRVHPYGNVGDDSWGLDKNKTQGYGRFLGTRELFGKVEIVTDKAVEFKEVSSRDGGLVETTGKKKLFELFDIKALKRLERYVSGVLWGEAFKRKSYFINEDIADQIRNDLREDKDKDSYDDIRDNIGSKIDFVNLIKSLSDDENITIIEYNRELVDLVNERLEIVQPKFLIDLEKIAEKTNDQKLLKELRITEENFNKLIAEKNAAEARETEERQRRIAAEEKAKHEEQKRKEAEAKAFEEQLKRKEAELVSERRERARIQAENERLKAEKRALDEIEKRKIEESKSQALNEKLSIESQKNQYLNATRKSLSDDAAQLIHSIDLYVGNASTYINELLSSSELDHQTKNNLYYIKNNIDKALKVSQIIIKSNFDYKHTSQRIDLPRYISEYLQDLGFSRRGLSILIDNPIRHFSFLNPIEIDLILDNLVSNSAKAGANKIIVEFSKDPTAGGVTMNYYDDGKGVPDRLRNNPASIFELGVRESDQKGSGIGMYDAKKRMQSLKGDIEFIGNNIKLKGAAFKLSFK